MKLSGYTDIQESELSRLSADILERFMSQTEDRRTIFRALGAHEIAAARGLLELARESKSDNTRLQAWTLICKVLGILKDNAEVNQGDMITNIFRQEITRRYEVTNITINSPKSLPDHTDNTQNRYEPSKPLAITDPQKEKE